jgi:hypothetical protein
MVEPLRHRQTKGAATDMPDLLRPRHIPTLPFAETQSDTSIGRDVPKKPAFTGEHARRARCVLVDSAASLGRRGSSITRPGELPESFERIVRSWDTASKVTELSPLRTLRPHAGEG